MASSSSPIAMRARAAMAICVVVAAASLVLAEEGAQTRRRVVVNTWPFTRATAAAWAVLEKGGTHVDAAVAGTSECEALQCDGSVGFGGSPDEAGETTLDAMVMDAETMNVGSVGALRNVRSAAKAARLVLDYTQETLLVGDQATAFAVQMGLKYETLETPESREMYENWRNASCQPNYWATTRGLLVPSPQSSCGPYSPAAQLRTIANANANAYAFTHADHVGTGRPPITRENHDTIGMVVIDASGAIAAATSTNGANHKVAGRVGDSPIAGAGAYANRHGGCASTGDGDIMMRFLPCYQAIESMRLGSTPCEAAVDAISRITEFYPDMSGAVIVVGSDGSHAGAASRVWHDVFKYSVQNDDTDGVAVFGVCDKEKGQGVAPS